MSFSCSHVHARQLAVRPAPHAKLKTRRNRKNDDSGVNRWSFVRLPQQATRNPSRSGIFVQSHCNRREGNSERNARGELEMSLGAKGTETIDFQTRYAWKEVLGFSHLLVEAADTSRHHQPYCISCRQRAKAGPEFLRDGRSGATSASHMVSSAHSVRPSALPKAQLSNTPKYSNIMLVLIKDEGHAKFMLVYKS